MDLLLGKQQDCCHADEYRQIIGLAAPRRKKLSESRQAAEQCVPSPPGFSISTSLDFNRLNNPPILVRVLHRRLLIDLLTRGHHHETSA
jgi:hypothetical protein